jgi:hypothetical protein
MVASADTVNRRASPFDPTAIRVRDAGRCSAAGGAGEDADAPRRSDLGTLAGQGRTRCGPKSQPCAPPVSLIGPGQSGLARKASGAGLRSRSPDRPARTQCTTSARELGRGEEYKTRRQLEVTVRSLTRDARDKASAAIGEGRDRFLGLTWQRIQPPVPWRLGRARVALCRRG